jgi:outer membrane protein assembly factor BamB
MTMQTHRLLVMISLLGMASLSSARAGDWPQILGPTRNGISGEKLPAHFPAGGPQAAWSATAGQGYAGPAVADGRVVLFHRIGGKERVAAFDAASGKPLWATDFPAHYRGGFNDDTGPRCVPLIHDGHVYVYGASGDCHCLEVQDGGQVWSRALGADYNAPEGYFGAGSTPILLGDKLLVDVGGKKAGIVGLNIESGDTAWTATTDEASYSSPASIVRGKQHDALFITRLNCVQIDPSTGKAATLFKFGKSGPTVNAAAPLINNGLLFVTASYGVGARCSKLAGGEVVWADDDTLSSQYSTPVIRDGYLYGIHGREDIPPAHLRCVELKTGKVMWSEESFGVAHPILAGDKLLLLTIEGDLVLAEASPKAYRELGRATIAKSTTRALPALSNGRIYCRSKDKLICIKLAE